MLLTAVWPSEESVAGRSDGERIVVTVPCYWSYGRFIIAQGKQGFLVVGEAGA